MNEIKVKLTYNCLDGYDENDFKKILVSKIDEEPKEENIQYEILFNEDGCIITAKSIIYSSEMLRIYIEANILRINEEYKYISDFDISH